MRHTLLVLAPIAACVPSENRDRSLDIDPIVLRADAVGIRATFGRSSTTLMRGKTSVIVTSAEKSLSNGRFFNGRIEYARPTATEWWRLSNGGVEQGWTVLKAPETLGQLRIGVRVTGAVATRAGDELWLQRGREVLFIVNHLHAEDADERPLPVTFGTTTEGFEVIVDDSAARYPVTVDPIYTTASETVSGAGNNGFFGASVAGVGDVEGDGYDDVLIGEPFSLGLTGAAYLYSGSASGLSAAPTATVTEARAQDYYATTVGGAGDVNGDGFADVVVGAFGDTDYAGRAYVYAGGPDGLSVAPATTLSGGARDDQLGNFTGTAGDTNGDGYDDVLIGAYGTNSYQGTAYVFSGSASGLDATAQAVLDGAAPNDRLGNFGGTAGDVDADGYDDVVIGAPGYAADTGRAYVYAGASAGVSATASTVLDGESAGDRFGGDAHAAGDVNGDGYVDIVIGATGSDHERGRAYVYMGAATGISPTAASTIDGAAPGEWLGYPVDSAGDVDDDGYADVLIGVYAADASTGRVELYAGSPSGLGESPIITLSGDAPGDAFGSAISAGGDADGDGRPEVIVSAPGFDSYRGSVRLYEGYPYADEDEDGYNETVDCDDGNADVHPGAAEVCDAANRDEDCSGLADDADAAATGQTEFYVDADGDGEGGTTAVQACDARSGVTASSTDCDDTNAAISSTAAEKCNGYDDNCDASTDGADAVDAATWYADADGDGFTDRSVTQNACTMPAGYAPPSYESDCDDTNADVFPRAAEIEGDGIDQDCDGIDARAPDEEDSVTPAKQSDTGGCACATDRNSPNAVLLGVIALALAVVRRKSEQSLPR